MFDLPSRYKNIETAQYAFPDGQVVAYRRRRFVPAPESFTTQAEVIPQAGERTDQFAARTLGDPLAFYHLADANNVLDPAELTSRQGHPVRIPFLLP